MFGIFAFLVGSFSTQMSTRKTSRY